MYYNTALRWVKDNKMPVAFERTPTGTITLRKFLPNPVMAQIELPCMPESPVQGKSLTWKRNWIVFHCLLQRIQLGSSLALER